MKARQILLDCLKEEGGKMTNQKALDSLSAKLGHDVSKEEYEEIKEQLLGLGLIEKGRGRGGSIQLPQNIDAEGCPAEDERIAEIREQLLLSIRRTPGAFAKMNKTTITCLLSSSKDKLYAEYEPDTRQYTLTYRVEKGKPDHTKTVVSVFKEASKDMECAEITTGKHYTRILLDNSLPRMNLLIRRLCDLLEEEDLENSLDDSRYWTLEFGADKRDSYFADVASIISFAAQSNLEWPFGSSFRKAFGFDAVDHLITIGRSYQAISAPPSQHYREHVVPAVRIKEKALEMAQGYASVSQISEFLRHHLLIVIVTREEAGLLDSQLTDDGIRLSTSMPANWVWGDDPLQRLYSAGIKVELFSEYRYKPWKPWKPQRIQMIRHWLNKPIIKV